MHQTPRLTLGYLHHAHAVAATEQLEAIELRAFTYLKSADRRRIVARLERAAAGRPPETVEEERARKEARWDAAWGQLRGIFGGPARIVAPRE
jgi:hypothetical protein